MKDEARKSLAPVLYIPHGGGPLPLLGDKGHKHLISFLREIAPDLGNPAAILIISAHWEEAQPTLTSRAAPALIYDYSGFPPEAYQIEYPAPGDPQLAERIHQLLTASGISAKLDDKRGFDHGLYVPLKIMYPEATIPCVQLSLLQSLDPAEHIRLGKALVALREENILIVGSGFSFHNMEAFSFDNTVKADTGNIWFDQWLVDTCAGPDLTPGEREKRLVEWEKVPHARYCHPREEHLLPLHVCYGIAGTEAGVVFNELILGKKATAFRW
jgi:aromatic ring-opening dioxygenase catalytic subunit (LigB family)